MDLSKGIVVLPPSLFLFLFLYFFIFVASLALSIYLSFVLFGIFFSSMKYFVCPVRDLFLTLRAKLYILQEV